MLRYQNKYRNMLKKQPELVRRAAQEAGIPEECVLRPQGLQRRLESEIDALYGKLAGALREENRKLREAVGRLTEENELLRRASRARGEKAVTAAKSAKAEE